MKCKLRYRWLAVSLSFLLILSGTVACGSASAEKDVTTTSEESIGQETVNDNVEEMQNVSSFIAEGTEAEQYNEIMERFVIGFQEYFSETNELEKVEGYEDPIAVSSLNWYSASMEDAAGSWASETGESLTYNRWNDAIKRVYNIDLTYSWQSQDADYDQKVRLDMAAGDLPDIFIVRSQSDLLNLARQGLIWDMTDIIEQYASDYDKNVWASDGGAAIDMATLDGKIYGIPSIQSATDAVSYLWIRKDWMEKLGLKDPETLDELKALMEAFVTQDPDGNGVDDTWGLYLYGDDLTYPLKGIYAAYGSYPESWYEKDGKVVYGGITEETKETLKYLAELYQQGLINPEFVAQDTTKANEYIMNNQVGVVYAGHWFGHTAGDLHEMNPDSDWKCVPLPTATGKPVRSILSPTQQGWVVVNSNFEYPEIALKLRSLTTYALLCEDSEWWWYDQNVSWNMSPVRCNVSAFDNLDTYLNLQEAYQKNDESVLKAKGVPYWANLHGENQWEWELMFGPDDDSAFAILEKSYDENLLFWDAFHGEWSELMQNNWSTIEDQQNMFFTDIIIGKLGAEEGFEQWVSTFNGLGGEQMTQEVNEWCKQHAD